MIMTASVSDEETLPEMVQEMNIGTPNSKMSAGASKSRIKGQVRHTVRSIICSRVYHSQKSGLM